MVDNQFTQRLALCYIGTRVITGIEQTMNARSGFDLEPGRKIGSRYKTVRPLGTGSEGEVYQIIDTLKGIARAAKLYYSSYYKKKSDTVVWHARKLHKLRRCKIVLQYHHMEMITVAKTRVLCMISDFCRCVPLESWICQHRGQRLHSCVALQVLYSLVCAQCHVEYYCSSEFKLTFPC